jgi:hypothetical protein
MDLQVSRTVKQEKLSNKRLNGTYSNHLQVGCNAFEFMLQFEQYRENDAEAVNVFAVVTSPAFAKAFARTLSDSITSYEERFGNIPDVD